MNDEIDKLPSQSILRLATLAIFAGFLTLLLFGISEPWLGGHVGFHGAMHHNFARNFSRHGVLPLHMGQSYDLDVMFPREGQYWTHRMPWVTLLFSGTSRMLGGAEWTMRLWPLIFSLGALGFLYRRSRQLWGEAWGAFAALLAAGMPAWAYFGRMVGYEIVCVSLCTMTLASFGRWSESPSPKRSRAVVAGFALSGLSGWFGLFLFPAFMLACLCQGLAKLRKGAGMFLAMGAVMLGLVVLFFALAAWQGEGPGMLWDYFVSNKVKLQSELGAGEFLHHVFKRLRQLVQPLPMILAAVWLGSLLWKKLRAKVDIEEVHAEIVFRRNEISGEER